MTNTKLCNECRHSSDNNKFSKCDSQTVIKLFRTVDINNRFYTKIARQFDYLCGPEAKHFEPIGGGQIMSEAKFCKDCGNCDKRDSLWCDLFTGLTEFARQNEKQCGADAKCFTPRKSLWQRVKGWVK